MKRTVNVLLLLVTFLLGILVATALNLRPQLIPSQPQRRAALATNTKPAAATTPAPTNTTGPTATETFPPYTPLPSLTPSRTLRPPPTFEPPTATSQPTLVPSITTVPTLDLSVSVPGLNGAETPTPSTTPGCTPKKEWKLTYTVKRGDALARIADTYGTTADDIAQANCLPDKNVIVEGQVLKVPGTSQPVQPEVACKPFELLTPMDNTLSVDGTGDLSFVWVGPRANYNLIRIFRPDGSKYERVVELRQNEQISLVDNLAQGGTYTWYVYPLDHNFVQACPEGGPWRFTKPTSPTITPTVSSSGGVVR